MILNKNWNFYYVFKFDHIKLMTTVHTMQSGSRSKSHIIRNGVVSHATRPHERYTQNRPKIFGIRVWLDHHHDEKCCFTHALDERWIWLGNLSFFRIKSSTSLTSTLMCALIHLANLPLNRNVSDEHSMRSWLCNMISILNCSGERSRKSKNRDRKCSNSGLQSIRTEKTCTHQ